MAHRSLGNPTEEQLPAALELFYQHLAPADQARAMDETLGLYKTDELGLDDVLVLREDDEICGVLICTVEPGAVGRCWPPQFRPHSDQENLEDQLVQAALDRLTNQSVSLMQCLLVSDDVDHVAPLVRNGFRHISPLLLMERTLEGVGGLDYLEGPPGLILEPHDEENADTFLNTLLESYVDSLDFPELVGARKGSDILAGHQAHGDYDPDRWMLVRDMSEPIGVMILTAIPEWNEWELSYLGIVPKGRRRGFGRYLVSEAIWQAHLGQAERLVVAVDERNEPALSLYSAFGFQIIQKQEAYLYFPSAGTGS